MKKISFVTGLMILALFMFGCEKEFGVTKVSPAIGVISGGEPVEIIGTGFAAGMGLTVYFGNFKADNVAIRGKEKLTISSPSANEAGPVDVRVITDDGREFLLKQAFTYVESSNMDIRDLGKRRSLRDKD